jgi:serine/threonine-protein kinase RsbW
MDGITERYTDLERAIDEVRVLLDRWSDERRRTGQPPPDPQSLRYAQLILHEWLANLLQHASFPEVPVIEVRVESEDQCLCGVVVDNSTGFDIGTHLNHQRQSSESLPERGMGLRIISACSDEFSYARGDNGQYRFEFSIPADHDPWLSTLF